MSEFDRIKAANESLKYDSLNRGGYELFVDGAEWQHSQDQKTIEELVKVLEKIANHEMTSIDKVYLINLVDGYRDVAKAALEKVKKEAP